MVAETIPQVPEMVGIATGAARFRGASEGHGKIDVFQQTIQGTALFAMTMLYITHTRMCLQELLVVAPGLLILPRRFVSPQLILYKVARGKRDRPRWHGHGVSWRDCQKGKWHREAPAEPSLKAGHYPHSKAVAESFGGLSVILNLG